METIALIVLIFGVSLLLMPLIAELIDAIVIKYF